MLKQTIFAASLVAAAQSATTASSSLLEALAKASQSSDQLSPIAAVPKNLAQVGANLSSTLTQEGEKNNLCNGDKTISIDHHQETVIDADVSEPTVLA